MAFLLKFLDHFTGGSGRELGYSISSDLMEIYEGLDWELKAEIDRERPKIDVPGEIVSFFLRTREGGWFGFRHPDLFAAKFVPLALDHLSRQHPIHTIHTKWTFGPNLKQFREAEKALKPVQAANTTWSGKLFNHLGFYIPSPQHIFVERDKGKAKEVHAYFVRD